MRRLLASFSVLTFVALSACGGGAASSGSRGASKPSPTEEVNNARAEAEAQEHKLSELRQDKADLEAQLEGKAAPAPAAAPAAAATTPAAKAAPVAAPAAAPAKAK